ncbi:hypothetical protein RHS01_03157 [Rhizoctonia solani]|uniref:Uncharacterized protein n=1 Tax=Rhizoctonia solani TaxID=456999 RepID=A0A8H7ILC0_9AGAM|nr:hypothetical protein RHS01_03157 [Rhizoctonia solani]
MAHPHPTDIARAFNSIAPRIQEDIRIHAQEPTLEGNGKGRETVLRSVRIMRVVQNVNTEAVRTIETPSNPQYPWAQIGADFFGPLPKSTTLLGTLTWFA